MLYEVITKVVQAVIEAGAKTVNIPDTVGYTIPSEYFNIIRYLKENVPNIEKAVLSVHCHNDLGLSVANSLAAIQAGAGQVECTINGIGERAGNCSLEDRITSYNVCYTKLLRLPVEAVVLEDDGEGDS